MLKTGLEFAPGTTEHCQKIIYGMFDPDSLFLAYRAARQEHKTNDLVLVCPNQDPNDLFAGSRSSMSEHLKKVLGRRALELKMTSESAHSVMKMPVETDAFWLVVVFPQQDIQCVMFAMPYEQVAPGALLTGEA